MTTTRRNFIAKSVLTAAGITAGANSGLLTGASLTDSISSAKLPGINDPDAFKISVFSKHFHWLDYTQMADALAEIGFDGADLTVRPGGHVEPEKVEQDLPKAVEALSKKGKKVYMITTAIDNADDPLTVKVLKTSAALGIKHYRMGWGHYDNTKSVEANIASMQAKLGKLALLNEKYSISGEYQNHSGVAKEGIYFGGAIWDTAMVLKAINSKWLNAQYDVYHATVEGANTWPVGLRLIAPWIRSIDIKDFEWIKEKDSTRSESIPLGTGRVDFKKYFAMLKEMGINVPISIHYEYPLGGADSGATKLTIKREDLISAMKRDLAVLKNYLKEAGLA
ncbi:MAG: sugar phosphate isomerase/epimerase [Bacteroidetes bacterium]|nr:sugar phosphate isomerase/epimerase [Bacteroidota bacterium]